MIALLLCILKSIFFKKIFLKAISKVDVNFNELHVKLICNPEKNGFHSFYKKTIFNQQKSEIQ